MIQILVILIVGSLLAREGFMPPLWRHLSAPQVVAWSLIPQALLLLAMGLFVRACSLRLQRTGAFAAVEWADRVVMFSRWSAVLWHVVAVLGFGWLDAVRSFTGDIILVDEVLAGAPPILAIVGAWWALYPIDRCIREAGLIAALDQGRAIHPVPSRAQYVVMQVRHHLLLVLLPMTLLTAWSESTARLIEWLSDRDVESQAGALASLTRWLAQPASASLAHSLLQGVGVLTVFIAMPIAISLIWDTIPLGEGPTRERLLGLCTAHGVRIRDLLVWRTRGSMINGAVIGLIGPLRYVLLTDSLLERLPEDQVEAVMAHEVGHARRRHVPWLAACLFASVGVCTVLIDGVLRILPSVVTLRTPQGLLLGAIQAGLTGVALGGGLAIFGWISRRFEWQADAFAVQHLSGLKTGRAASADSAAVSVSESAVLSMAGALNAVARLNFIPRGKFSWRHGSIQRRVDNLAVLVGRPAAKLPIDSLVRVIKLCSALAVAGLIALAALGW